MMAYAQIVETSVSTITNGPSQDYTYTHPIILYYKKFSQEVNFTLSMCAYTFCITYSRSCSTCSVLNLLSDK